MSENKDQIENLDLSHCYAASFLHVKASPELDAPNEHSLSLIVGDQKFHLGYYEDECSAERRKAMWAKALSKVSSGAYCAVINSAVDVIRKASIGDQNFIQCLRGDDPNTTALRDAVVDLGDAMRAT